MYRREQEEKQDKKETNHQIIERSLLTVGILALAVAVPIAFLALGCGKQNETAATGATQEQVSETRQAGGTHEAGGSSAGQIVVASTGGLTQGESPAGGGLVTDTAGQAVDQVGMLEAVHPEVVASAPDSVLTPGTVAEITAEGSPDVSDVVLTDRLGKKTAFTYDTARSIWRVAYRVPLRSREDLIGLSVTATNPGGLSKRVWVFLKFREATDPASVQTESAN